jgi:hypothetical protein
MTGSGDDLLAEHLLLNTALDIVNSKLDVAQSRELAYHKKHLQALWRHVQRLERVLSVGDGVVTLKTGDAALTLKKDGTITLKGKNIKVEGWGSIEIKAGSNVTIKGARILEN